MSYELIVNSRTTQGKAVRASRRRGILPGVIYGHGQQTRLVEFPLPAFLKIYSDAGESSLISVKFEGSAETVAALIQDVQRDPVNDSVLHVDFHQVNLKEKIITQVPLLFEGIAPAVKELGAVLVKSLDHVEVECLPTDLISHITVDCSQLKTLDDAILVRDIHVPSTMTVRTKPEEIVASVQMTKAEEVTVEAAQSEAQAVESVEVVKKGKEHEQEGEESKDTAS
ncbi:50S ribosomal protein L25 [Candidatus Uhrbacteria bacterium]|nr:50S ribosomal protein L25 [Candidatus Uhrbacteria bacterium]